MVAHEDAAQERLFEWGPAGAGGAAAAMLEGVKVPSESGAVIAMAAAAAAVAAAREVAEEAAAEAAAEKAAADAAAAEHRAAAEAAAEAHSLTLLGVVHPAWTSLAPHPTPQTMQVCIVVSYIGRLVRKMPS